MRWNEVTGAIARRRRASTRCGRPSTLASGSRWTCSGTSRRPIARRPQRPCIKLVLGRKNSKNDATVAKISGFFFKSFASRYLVLLGISQTCRFQEKSFLKFLLSGEMDVDCFRPSRRRRTTRQLVKSPMAIQGGHELGGSTDGNRASDPEE